jgi:hypothetical protein
MKAANPISPNNRFRDTRQEQAGSGSGLRLGVSGGIEFGHM